MKNTFPPEPNEISQPAEVLTFRERFRRFAQQVAFSAGSPMGFLISCMLILTWAAMGPFFGFSDTWQLVINTATTIITFLMVFLIQNTQNRDAKAIHLKLDELIRSAKGARNGLVCLEDLSEAELAELEKEFARLRDHSQCPKLENQTSPDPVQQIR